MTTTDVLIDAVSQWAPGRIGRPAVPPTSPTELRGSPPLPGQAARHDRFPAGTATAPGYRVRLASSAEDVVAAQRLRRQVRFAGGDSTTVADHGLPTVVPTTSGTDRIEQYFDDRSDHLLVWHQPVDGRPELVAAARLLPPHANDASPRGAGLLADLHFGLRPLERLLNSTIEVSAAGVHPDHRAGTAAALLLGGIAGYQHLTGYRYLLGSVPVALQDGGESAAAVWDLALTEHLAPAERRCRPRDPIAIGRLPRSQRPDVPALLRGCLRLGAKVCGPPGDNETAGTADFLLLLDLQDPSRGRLPGLG